MSLIPSKPTRIAGWYFLYRKVTAQRLTHVLRSVFTLHADFICLLLLFFAFSSHIVVTNPVTTFCFAVRMDLEGK
jgi:hypothetical protein